jgi:hypothetical protein
MNSTYDIANVINHVARLFALRLPLHNQDMYAVLRQNDWASGGTIPNSQPLRCKRTTGVRPRPIIHNSQPGLDVTRDPAYNIVVRGACPRHLEIDTAH